METSNPTTPEVIPVSQAIAKLPGPGEELGGLVTYLDTSTWEGKAAILNAMQGQDAKLQEMIGLPLKIVNFVAAPVRLIDHATGEEKIVPRCVLIAEDGARISAASDGVLNSLRSICAVFGNPPWNPPMPIVANEGKSNSGFRYYTLEVKANGKPAPVTETKAKAGKKE